MNKHIKQLSSEVANQIAAGEVVEGPASVIKELVENSVDAGADKIIIEVESAGKTKIVLTDNGCGVAKDELPRLLKRHCTSKLNEIDDLNSIRSMGFRGEALASIASVSRMRVRTRVLGDDHGWLLSCEGDSSEQVKITAYEQPMPVGTTMEVRDLFFRVPARQKNFLESDQAAMRNIKSVVKKMILAHPHVTVSLKTPDRTILHADGCIEQAQRINRLEVVFGKEFAQACLLVQKDLPWGQLIGWCAQPYFNRRYADMQVLLINNRPIRDKKLAFAVKRAYQDVMLPGRHPAFCLYLDIDPALVDVNVHPSKEKVRFADTEAITRGLKFAVEEVLRGQMNINKDHVDLSDRVGLAAASPIEVPTASKAAHTWRGQSQLSENIGAQTHRQSIESMVATMPDLRVSSTAERVTQAKNDHQRAIESIESLSPAPESRSLNDLQRGENKSSSELASPVQEAVGQSSAIPNGEKDYKTYSLGFALGQLHGLYVLAQNKDGLVIIDMHAAHERILYEKLKSSYREQGVTTQKLLVPYRCQLQNDAKDIIEQYGVLLLQMGLELSIDDENEVFLHAIPAILAKQNLDAIVQDVLQELAEYETTDHMQSALHKIFATMACHGAIRANRVLSLTEMNALLRQIEKTASSDYCNHGRPTWFVWDLDRVDAVFRRGQ